MIRAALAALFVAIAGCAAPPREAPAAAPPAAPTAGSAPAPSPVPVRTVTVRIDETITHQVVEGFGATITEHYDLSTGEDLMGALRPRVNEAVFGQIGITMGHLDLGPYENFTPAPRATANDDDDPFHYHWPAFNFVRSRGHHDGIVVPGRAYGFDNFSLHTGTNVRWSDPWMAEIRRKDYRRYLDEMAENVLAPLVHWRERYGIVARWHHLFNEPTTGNAELGGGGVGEVVDLVKTVGARLAREGFVGVRLAIASEETEEASLAAARAVLADPDARRYIGAITYHTYPYGSVYSRVDRILATSGEGRPDPGRVAVRRAIRDLAREHGLQVWMTEVSHGGAGPLDSLRGRAIQIHDEMTYADASSFWAMFQAWDAFAPSGSCDEDCLVHFNRVRGTVSISGTGHAIGHFARWIRRGALRVETSTDDAKVLAIAFRDDSRRRILVVAINNHRDPVTLLVRTSGAPPPDGTIAGEQSSAAGWWLPVAQANARDDGAAAVSLPGRSVTTLSLGTR